MLVIYEVWKIAKLKYLFESFQSTPLYQRGEQKRGIKWIWSLVRALSNVNIPKMLSL